MLVISPSIRNLLTSHKRTLLAAVFIFLYSFSITLAVPPATKYQPGATLDPACAPTDTNCSVQILPDQTSNANKYLTTDGSSTAWSSSTLVLGGNFTTSGAYATTLTATGTTTLTLPTSGTLYGTASSSITSSQLLTSLSDETGTGLLVFNTAPSFTTSIATPSIISASGALGITPASGSNLNITLATTGDFTVNTNQLYVDTSTGNVGVGTGSPAQKLDIVISDASQIPALRWGNTPTGYTMGYLTGDPTNYYSGALSLFNNNVANTFISANGSSYFMGGNVGIGTSSPGSKLTITGNTANSARLTVNGSDVNGVAISLSSSATNGRTWSIGSNYVLGQGEFTLYDATAGLSRLTIDSSGNLIVSDLAGSGNRCVYADANGQLNVKNDDCGLASGGDDMGDHTATQNIILGSNWLSGDGGNEGIKIDADGKVGIGAAPSIAKLDITTASGINLNLEKSTGAYFSLSRSGVITSSISGFSSGDGMSFNYGASHTEAMRIDGSGNVGIGTITPGAKLDISSGVYAVGNSALRIGADVGASTRTNTTRKLGVITAPHYTNAEEDVMIGWVDSDSATTNLMIGGGLGNQNAVTNLSFWTGASTTTTAGTQRMTIDSSGNVGIGTATPAGLFHTDKTGLTTDTSGESARFRGTITGATTYTDLIITNGVSAGSAANRYVALNVADHASAARALVMQSNGGNVGIGTTSPAARFDVRASDDTDANIVVFDNTVGVHKFQFYQEADGDGSLYIGNSNEVVIQESGSTWFNGGNVGIGTTSPNEKLEVVGTISSRVESGVAQSNYLRLGTYSSNGAWGSYISADSNYASNLNTNLKFGVSNAGSALDAMTILSTGNIGIGTATPSFTFEVKNKIGPHTLLGGFYFSGTNTTQGGDNSLISTGGYYNGSTMTVVNSGAAQYQQAEGNHYFYGNVGLTPGVSTTLTQRMVITSAGDVGIGATSPGYKLEVAGTANFTGDVSIGTLSQARHLNLFITPPLDGKIYWSATTQPNVAWIGATGTPNLQAQVGGSGGVSLTSGATSWAAISDERLKVMDEFTPFANSLEKILTLRTGTTRYKTDPIGVSRSFLIAQDVQKILPEAVSVGTDEMKTLSLRYEEVIPLIIKSIQEMDIKVTSISDMEQENTWRDSLLAWFADATNGIDDFFANRVRTKELCVEKSDGTEFCANGDQLEALLGDSGNSSPEPEPQPTPDAPVDDAEPAPEEDLSAPDEGGQEDSPAEDPLPDEGQTTTDPLL